MSFGRAIKRMLAVIFIEDIPLKMVCLILAALFWFYIDGELTDEREVAVRLTAADIPLPKGMGVSSERDLPEVTVKVRGPRRRLQYFSARDIRVNLQEALPAPVRGPQSMPLRRQYFSGEDVVVVSVAPEHFILRLTKMVRRTLPVRVTTAGEVPPGYRLTEARPEPREVVVESKEDIEAAEAVWTLPISVRERREPFEVFVPVAETVQVGDRDVKVQCAEQVAVSLKIVREETQRVLEGVTVRASVPPGAALFIDPATVNIRVSGPQEVIAPLQNKDIDAYVEWPPEWSTRGGETSGFEASVQVKVRFKVSASPLLKVSGEEDAALPTVKVRGRLVPGASGR